MLRSHTCGQLRESDIGTTATLCGWVFARRDHGKLIFIDITDRYGVTQVVITPKPFPDAYEQARQLKTGDAIKVTGEVNRRPGKTENPRLPTGLVEVFTQAIEILGPASELPFPPEDEIEVSEEVRLYHRYLDLRRNSVRDKFILRHRFNHAFRRFLDSEGFLEVETPFLTKSTPEGARDFLVPSRLNPCNFYALPQSPQLFKQILMVSGFDKYYQIARCFRDEDLRKDRQPEFTQLDLEASFVDEEDIYALSEKMFAFVFKEVLGVDLPTPFPRISYKEAREKYNSDKPDVGEGPYRFLWVCDFPLFEYDQEQQRWDPSHHPFTAPHPDDLGFLGGDNAKVRARAYDLVLNGTELASGSVRIHSQELQKKIFSLIGISPEEAQKKFAHLLRAFQYGAPPHAGIAFGLDRFYAMMTGSESIREVIAFPKTQKGFCLLTDAPSSVAPDQLAELFIDVCEQEKGGEK